MKKNILFYWCTAILLSPILIISCSDEIDVVVETVNKESISFEKAESIISSLGFDTSDLYLSGDYYVIEGDIIINKDSLESYETSSQLRQFRDQNIVGLARSENLTIGVASSLRGTDWERAVKEVANAYTNVSGSRLKLTYTTSNPNILISWGYDNDMSVCAWGEFPSTYGVAGKNVFLNTNCRDDWGRPMENFLSLSQRIFLLAHEVGHNLGFRHTNVTNNPNAILIPGTTSNDPNSVMNSNTCGLFWNGFSEKDRYAIKELWPTSAIWEVKLKGNSYVEMNGQYYTSFRPSFSVDVSGTYSRLEYEWKVQGDGVISGSNKSNIAYIQANGGTIYVSVTVKSETGEQKSSGGYNFTYKR